MSKKRQTIYRKGVQLIEKYPSLHIFLYSLKTFTQRLVFGINRYFIHFEKLHVSILIIPKIANSSLKRAFIEKVSPDFTYTTFHDMHNFSKKYTMSYDTFLKSKSYKFTFVRNPFDKIVSCYENKTQRYDFNLIYNSFWLYKQNMSFERFVKVTALIPDRLSDIHLISQSALIKNSDLFDFIGRFENLAEDYAIIATKFKLKSLPHINKTVKSKKWQYYYTPKTAQLIYKRYQKDFDTWYPNAYEELLSYLKNNK